MTTHRAHTPAQTLLAALEDALALFERPISSERQALVCLADALRIALQSLHAYALHLRAAEQSHD